MDANITKVYKKQNHYFTTYWIYDNEKKTYIGVLEDHHTDVKSRYFIGWHFKSGRYIPNTYQPAETALFETEAAAIDFILYGGKSHG